MIYRLFYLLIFFPSFLLGVSITFTDTQTVMPIRGKSLLCLLYTISSRTVGYKGYHSDFPILQELKDEKGKNKELKIYYCGCDGPKEIDLHYLIKHRLWNILTHGADKLITYHPFHLSAQQYMKKHCTPEQKHYYQSLKNIVTGYQMMIYLDKGIKNQNNYFYENDFVLTHPDSFISGQIYALRNCQGKMHPMLHIGQDIFLSKMGTGAIVFHKREPMITFYHEEWNEAPLIYPLTISASCPRPTMAPIPNPPWWQHPLWQQKPELIRTMLERRSFSLRPVLPQIPASSTPQQ